MGGDGAATSETTPTPTRVQRVVVMRHGDRLDHLEPLWAVNAARPWDPPLADGGFKRAFATGKRLRAGTLGFGITRAFVSPFLRCVQTAAQAVRALCAVNDDAALTSVVAPGDDIPIDPSHVKVSIEYGLCEMLNSLALGPLASQRVPVDGNWFPNISELEDMFPTGTLDRSVDPVYKKMPQWGESVFDARNRYANIIQSLADKYPEENLLLVTHGEGVGSSVACTGDIDIYEVDYCAYSVLERSTVSKPGEASPASGKFRLLTKSGQSGILFVNRAERQAAHAQPS